MNERGSKKPGPRAGKGGPVIRRSASERKPVAKDLEAFAGGDDDALWRRPARHRLSDPRPVMLVPGVANRDARLVYEARERQLRAAMAAGDRDLLAVKLAEASRMRVWRGHSVVGWDVFVMDILQLSMDEANQLRKEGGERIGGLDVASEEVVASWMRAEAGIIEALGPDATVGLKGPRGEERLVFDLPVPDAAPALASMGRRAAPLAREAAEAKKSVVDRPHGVPRLSRLIQRDMGEDD